MIELMNAKQVLIDYWREQEKINEDYNLGNDQYCNGLYDAIRIIEKVINKEIERQADYYEETAQQTSDCNG